MMLSNPPLQTERDDGGLYGRLGWQTCERLPYHGYQANVMTKELGRRGREQGAV